MKQLRGLRERFRHEVFWFSAFAVAWFLMPLPYYLGELGKSIFLMFNRVYVWLTIAGCIVSVLRAQREKTLLLAKNPELRRQLPRQPGLLRFCTNPAAKRADLLLAATLPAVVLALLLKAGTLLQFVLAALLVFALSMHCLFNGRIYSLCKSIF